LVFPSRTGAQYTERPLYFYMSNPWSGYPVRSTIPYRLRRRYIHFPDVNLEIDPYVFVTQTWDSNIYYEPEDEKDDFVTTVSPGVACRWPWRAGRYLLKLGYVADIINFWEYTAESRVDHTAQISAQFDFNHGARLELMDRFRRTKDPADSENTQDYQRNRNIASAEISVEREKFDFGLKYTNIRDYYDDLEYLNKWIHIFSPRIYYRLLAKASLLAQYDYGLVRYDHPGDPHSNAEYHQPMLGLTGKLSQKLTGTIKAGYQWRYYSDKEKKDFTGWVVRADLRYDYSSRTSFGLFGERSVNESSYQNQSYYSLFRVGADVQQELGRRLILSLSGWYQLNKYPEETAQGTKTDKRKDNLWAGFADLRYQVLEWLSADLIYAYRKRDSDFPVFDYDRHQVSLQLAAIF
jgi:hypothetical protein